MSADETPWTDEQWLAAIGAADDPMRLTELVFGFYHDRGRFDRASRELMLLHIGMLSGMVMRVLEQRRWQRLFPELRDDGPT